jgi:hypothetical protein
VLIALLVLGASADRFGVSCARGHCCEAPHGGACQCLCHHVFVLEPVDPPSLAGRLPTESLRFAETGDFPPDAIPLGIDYPPGLG